MPPYPFTHYAYTLSHFRPLQPSFSCNCVVRICRVVHAKYPSVLSLTITTRIDLWQPLYAEQTAPKPSTFGGFFGAAHTAVDSAFHRLPPINYCTRKLKSIAGNDVSKKPFTSTEETPKVSAFLFDFGKGSVALPSHSLNTQLRQGDTSYPSREPTAKKKERRLE